MQKYILVINCGSSSLKYQLINSENEELVAKGLMERIGFGNGSITHSYYKNNAWQKLSISTNLPNHKYAFEQMAELLSNGNSALIKDNREILAVGHRVVHGGAKYTQAERITEAVKAEIRALIPLAPLHNPAHLAGIEAAEIIFPNSIHYAVFDTSFHNTIPEKAHLYAIPKKYATENHIRVYGFHGISHQYVYHRAKDYLSKPIKAISLHLGNGASITAINEKGQSVDTSMGLSPLTGLIMGTRSGDIDPSVIFYLHENLGLSMPEIRDILSKNSGMLGLTGSNDARDIGKKYLEKDADAITCYEMYSYRIQKYIGAYFAILGGVDALIFTGGIGENDEIIRLLVCQNLGAIGCYLDNNKNQKLNKNSDIIPIHSEKSLIPILVIATNEELNIARQARNFLT